MPTMNTIQMLGVGLLTPALTGVPQPAAARSTVVQQDVDIHTLQVPFESVEPSKARLLDVLRSLSPAEKLDMAGVNIKLHPPPTPKITRHPRSSIPPGPAAGETSIYGGVQAAPSAMCHMDSRPNLKR